MQLGKMIERSREVKNYGTSKGATESPRDARIEVVTRAAGQLNQTVYGGTCCCNDKLGE